MRQPTPGTKWAARGAAVALTASVLTGVGVATAGSSSALGSTCTPPGPHRPSGPVTLALRPLIGDPGYNNGALPAPLATSLLIVSGVLDPVVCQLLP